MTLLTGLRRFFVPSLVNRRNGKIGNKSAPATGRSSVKHACLHSKWLSLKNIWWHQNGDYQLEIVFQPPKVDKGLGRAIVGGNDAASRALGWTSASPSFLSRALDRQHSFH